MASSLFNSPSATSNGNHSGIPNSSSGNIIHRFAEFKRQMAGKDPEAIVKQMLADGRMSQAQFNNLKSQADSLMKILH